MQQLVGTQGISQIHQLPYVKAMLLYLLHLSALCYCNQHIRSNNKISERAHYKGGKTNLSP